MGTVSKNVVRLYKPPKPTLEDPDAQIKWMFFQIESEFEERYRARIRYAKNKYIEFIEQTNSYYSELEHNRRFYLEKYWEADALYRFYSWLSVQDLKSKTRYGLYSTVRKVMDVAYALRIIDTIVYRVPIFKGVPETKQRSAYAKREQEIINAAVGKWIGLVNSVLCGYIPTGEGIPYRRKDYLSKIVVDNSSYRIREASKVFGIKHGAITNRLKQGWTPRQAVGLDPSPHAPKLNWVLDGVAYKTVEAVAKKFGISMSVVHYRASKGWSPEQIVGLMAQPEKDFSKVTGKPTQITIDDIPFKSVKDACRHFGVNYKVATRRTWSGWTPREALGLDLREQPGTKIVVENVKYNSISAAAKAYRVSASSVALRLKKGFSPEQAVGIEPILVSPSDDRALLWMFENIYKCDAYAMREDFYNRRHQVSIICSDKRLLKLFARWGVWPYIDDRLVLPLALEMAMLTGLNVESLKLLEIDSLQLEHRLTGQPVIVFNKKRSGSSTRSEDRELHLPVLELEELFIADSAVDRVVRLWGLVLAITSKIRGEAPIELSSRLFIFEDVEHSRKQGKRMIVPIDPKGKMSTWYRRFCREEGLFDVFGADFNFNMSRCRPTLATNMVLSGAEIFQVQAVLGHASIQTTALYLDTHQLRPAFNKTVSEALECISRRSRELRQDAVIAQPILALVEECDKQGFHETLSGCGCVNPYRPSDNVRAVTKLQDGAVCKYWNMCLLCDNAVITESSLPKLVLYRNRVAAAVQEDSPSIRARKKLYQDVLKLIDGILESDVIFPASIIESAKCLAARMDDLLVDQLVYQGI